jgi:hypothetical protein
MGEQRLLGIHEPLHLTAAPELELTGACVLRRTSPRASASPEGRVPGNHVSPLIVAVIWAQRLSVVDSDRWKVWL